MTKEAKFEAGDKVKVGTEQGTVEESCPTASGGWQYRVRCDMTDKWVPEEDVKAGAAKKAAAPKAPKAPVVPE